MGISAGQFRLIAVTLCLGLVAGFIIGWSAAGVRDYRSQTLYQNALDRLNGFDPEDTFKNRIDP